MEKNITFKERLALSLILLAIKLINPYGYSQEIKDSVKQVDELLKEAKVIK